MWLGEVICGVWGLGNGMNEVNEWLEDRLKQRLDKGWNRMNDLLTE